MNFQLIVFLIISGLVVPFFVFVPTPNLAWGIARAEPISPPETLEETREIGERILETVPKELPGVLERIWKGEVLPIWRRIYNWAKKNLWDPYIWPFFQNIWQRIQAIFRKEIRERKEIIEEELERKKEEFKKEMKEEVPKVTKSIWQRFKELIK